MLKPLPYFAALAGLLYNSWLLAYWLNPSVLHIGLSSDLEAAGQPYNWVFISLDVMTALLMLVVLVLLRSRLGAKTVLLGYGVFAVMTGVSAVLPLHCSSDIAACGFQAGQRFGVHDLASGIAAFGLFVSLAGWWWHKPRSGTAASVLGTYMLIGLVFLWATMAGRHTVGVQQIFLLINGVAIWFIPIRLADYEEPESAII